MQFKDLNIMPEILRALKNENYKKNKPMCSLCIFDMYVLH